MKAVEDNIQTVIAEVASEVDPNVDDANKNLNGNPDVGDGSDQDDDQGNLDDPNGNKDNKAFAAMRVANKELRVELDSLKAKFEEITKNKVDTNNSDDPNDSQKSDEDNLKIKETDSEEVKLLKAELAQIKTTTEELKQDRSQRLDNEKKAQMINELTQLKTKYKLDEKRLLEFADKAEQNGFVLGQTPLSVDQIYTLVYHDDLVAQALKNIENQANENLAPGSGPNGAGGSGNKTVTKPKDVVASIIKELGLE